MTSFHFVRPYCDGHPRDKIKTDPNAGLHTLGHTF
jgi:hypothetical protein